MLKKYAHAMPWMMLVGAAVLPMQSMAKTTAATCFNAALYQVGNQYRMVSPKTSAILNYQMLAPDSFM